MTAASFPNPLRNAVRLAGAGLVLAALASGCAPSNDRMRIDPVVVNDVLARAAAQVRRCYRTPRVPHAARQIVTTIWVRFNPDGTLAQLPVWSGQSGVNPDTQPYAAELAEAATLAVIRCAPLSLPAEHYGAIWRQFELSFRFSSRG